MAPPNVNRVRTLSMYWDVFFPGLIPGMYPPYFFMLSATSTGLNVTAV